MIKAAQDLVRKKGFCRFTLNEASRTAGVSVSALSNYFEDKEALLVEIILLGNQIMESELRAAADMNAPLRDRLVAVCLAKVVEEQHG